MPKKQINDFYYSITQYLTRTYSKLLNYYLKWDNYQLVIIFHQLIWIFCVSCSNLLKNKHRYKKFDHSTELWNKDSWLTHIQKRWEIYHIPKYQFFLQSFSYLSFLFFKSSRAFRSSCPNLSLLNFQKNVIRPCLTHPIPTLVTFFFSPSAFPH